MRTTLFAHAVCLGAVGFASIATAQTAADVGDLDSFGRNVIYLGSTQIGRIFLQPDCTPDPAVPPEEGSRCITVPPDGAGFNESNLATIRLPARATRSMVCFSLTPTVNFAFSNTTGSRQTALFSARTVVTVESSVLNDPGLIDPNTGLPYNGRMTIPLSTYSESTTLDPGEREAKQLYLSRNCVGGLISRSSLQGTHGLSALQASLFFSRPITLSFGAVGSAQSVESASYVYGIRLYGDR